jgi:aconitate hydratase
LVTKIFKEHMQNGSSVEPGEEVGIQIDQALLQDATGTMACMQLEQIGVGQGPGTPGRSVHRPQRYPARSQEPDDHLFLQGFAAKYGMYYSKPGNGICHYVHVERFAKPGATMVGADSHTTSSGLVGTIAIGVGGLDVALVLAGRPFETGFPTVIGVELTASCRIG